MIKVLSKEADLVVALSSQPFENDSSFADSIRGIDFILGDYGNNRMLGPHLVNTTIIYNSGRIGNGIAEIDISIRDKNFGLNDITVQNATLEVLQQQIDEYKASNINSTEYLESKQQKFRDNVKSLINTVSFTVSKPTQKASTSEKIDLALKELANLYSKDE